MAKTRVFGGHSGTDLWEVDLRSKWWLLWNPTAFRTVLSRSWHRLYPGPRTHQDRSSCTSERSWLLLLRLAHLRVVWCRFHSSAVCGFRHESWTWISCSDIVPLWGTRAFRRISPSGMFYQSQGIPTRTRSGYLIEYCTFRGTLFWYGYQWSLLLWVEGFSPLKRKTKTECLSCWSLTEWTFFSFTCTVLFIHSFLRTWPGMFWTPPSSLYGGLACPPGSRSTPPTVSASYDLVLMHVLLYSSLVYQLLPYNSESYLISLLNEGRLKSSRAGHTPSHYSSHHY